MRARRSDLTVTPGGALLLAAALFFLDDETLLSLAVSAAVHEAGHFFALTALGAGVEHIRLTLTGLEIAYAPATLSYGDEAVCALTGPAFGAAAAFLFSAFGLYTAAGVSALNLWP